MKQTAKKKAPARLLWSEDGKIGCERKGHAPAKGTDTFRRGRWREPTLAECIAFAGEIGRWPTCETCDAEKRRKTS